MPLCGQSLRPLGLILVLVLLCAHACGAVVVVATHAAFAVATTVILCLVVIFHAHTPFLNLL